MRRRVAFWIVFALGAAGAIGTLLAGRAWIVADDNRRQVSEIAGQIVSRAEVAVDLAVIQLGELIGAGLAACSPEAQAAVRRAVFAVGSLKDIHIVTGQERCSGFPDAGPAFAD